MRPIGIYLSSNWECVEMRWATLRAVLQVFQWIKAKLSAANRDFPGRPKRIPPDFIPNRTAIGSQLDAVKIPIGRYRIPIWTLPNSQLDVDEFPIGR